jgi:putative hemolysin
LLWTELALVAGLVLLNAAFAGSELALVSLRESQIARLEQHSFAGRAVARLARDPNRFLATIQVGITLAGFMASATAAVSLAEPLYDPLSFLGGSAEAVAVILVTLVLAFFTLVLGELAPKRIAMQRAERWALLAGRPLELLSTAMRPVIWLLSVSTNLVVRLLGGNPALQRPDVTTEEIRDMIATQAGFTPEARRVVKEALEAGERTVGEVMRPRTQVFALRNTTEAGDAMRQLVEAGHTRAPVFKEALDDIVGLVHLRDLVSASGPIGAHLRPALAIPDSVTVLDALRRLQREQRQMGLVIDEFGGVAGIVTVEDLVEEIVGEIYDEFDRDVRAAGHAADGALELPGQFPIHDLVDLGVSLPEGDYTTIAGLVLDRLGRIPGKGDGIVESGWHVEVAEMDRVAIRKVRLRRVETNAQVAQAEE